MRVMVTIITMDITAKLIADVDESHGDNYYKGCESYDDDAVDMLILLGIYSTIYPRPEHREMNQYYPRFWN